MSKKRQNRNTKKMQKALGSKRTRAGYRVGGPIGEDVRVSNPRQRAVLTNQEPEIVSNRPKSSLISEFQQPIAKAPQESITKDPVVAQTAAPQQQVTTLTQRPVMVTNQDGGSVNPRLQEQTQSLPGYSNFGVPGNTPPKKTESPIGLDPGRPDTVELPQVKVEDVAQGPRS